MEQLCEMLPNLFSPIHCRLLIDVHRPEEVDISIGVSFVRKHGPFVATTVRPGEFDPARVCRWWLKCRAECTHRWTVRSALCGRGYDARCHGRG